MKTTKSPDSNTANIVHTEGNNMNFRNATAGLSFVVLLTGCAVFPQDSIYRDYAAPPLVYDAESAGPKLIAAIIKTSGANPTGLVEAGCLNAPVAAAEAAKCQQQRNVALITLLTASDNICQSHVKTIFGNEAAFNITTGTITNIASGWGAIATGSAAKSVLSSIAFLSNAERSLVNESVYKNMLVTAVTKKIGEARTNIKSSISAKFSSSVDSYSVLTSINDIIGYHDTCAFMYGLQKALEEGSQPNAESRRVKLEQDKHDLEIYLQTRKTLIGAAAATTDEGLLGARARVKAIEEELLKIVKAQK